MIIILDKSTKQVKDNLGTNSLFPDGSIPDLEPKENEIFVKIRDNSEFSRMILTAYDYSLELDENNKVTNIVVHKTLEQYNSERKSDEDVNNLFTPNDDAILDAKVELKVIETLIELEVI